ncbi:FAD-dependent oxidoreductase, partial [Burkholderia pseudomallei]|uniref:FAD-dependent oxidoreductase n=1 Tax=Burkholderia pseudomallei TaxID=28450 RepID=UPI0029323A8D
MTNEILTVDVAIVGAGPAGLAAARAAARSGCTVAIVDDNPRAGGQVWRHGPHAAPGALARASFGVLRQPNVRHLAATRVVAAPRPGRQQQNVNQQRHRDRVQNIYILVG